MNNDPKKEKPIASDTRYCPKCNADWQGSPIPEKVRQFSGNITHGSRVIWLYSPESERVIALRCPDCKAEFPR